MAGVHPLVQLRFYLMMLISVLCVKGPRGSLNSIVPEMGADPSLGLSGTQQAGLLSAFYPGYLLTQMPAGPLVQRFGGKGIMTLNLVGTAAVFLAMPRTLSRSGPWLASILLGILGLLQGPMSPCLSQLNREWIPAADRAYQLRIQGLAHQSAPMLAMLLTPLLARRGGWRFVFVAVGSGVGVFSALWQLLMTAKPPQSTAAPPVIAASPTEKVKASTDTPTSSPLATTKGGSKRQAPKGSPPKAEAADDEGPVVEYRIFTLPSVIALIGWQVASNFLFMCLQQWGPTFYQTTLGCSSARAGLLLSLGQSVNFVGAFVGAAAAPPPPPRLHDGGERSAAVSLSVYYFAAPFVACVVCPPPPPPPPPPGSDATRCDAVRAGSYCENALLRRMSNLNMRRTLTIAASAVEGLFAFGCEPPPLPQHKHHPACCR
jgi:sugar phosphate permease